MLNGRIGWHARRVGERPPERAVAQHRKHRRTHGRKRHRGLDSVTQLMYGAADLDVVEVATRAAFVLERERHERRARRSDVRHLDVAYLLTRTPLAPLEELRRLVEQGALPLGLLVLCGHSILVLNGSRLGWRQLRLEAESALECEQRADFATCVRVVHRQVASLNAPRLADVPLELPAVQDKALAGFFLLAEFYNRVEDLLLLIWSKLCWRSGLELRRITSVVRGVIHGARREGSQVSGGLPVLFKSQPRGFDRRHLPVGRVV